MSAVRSLRCVAAALVVVVALGLPPGGAGPELAAPAVVLADDACPATPAPASAPKLRDALLQPFIAAAQQRRATRSAADPAFATRVDSSLNQNLVNFALLGWGESGGDSYDQMQVSITILSLDVGTDQVTSLSLSRDIRVPELEDRTQGIGRPQEMLRRVFLLGGFDGTRTVLEDATGLSIDFEVIVKDTLVRDYLQDVSGPIELDVPKEHLTTPYPLDGIEYPGQYIPAGPQVMTAQEAMTYILSEDLNPQGRADERSYRKNQVMHALFEDFRSRAACQKDPGFLWQLARFVVGHVSR